MIYILLPTFNESAVIEALIRNIHSQLLNQQHSIVVVNDGSTDNTLSLIEKLCSTVINLKIINHKMNLGLGKAMNTGFNYLSEIITDKDILITMDADNTHPVNIIPQLISGIKNDFDVIIASRYALGGNEIGLSWFRKILSFGASKILKLFFSINNVTDYTCGYRAYSGKIIKKAEEFYRYNFITETGFTCMAEILLKLDKIGAKIQETGLVLRYDLKRGKSKIKILRTIIDYMILIFKLKCKQK